MISNISTDSLLVALERNNDSNMLGNQEEDISTVSNDILKGMQSLLKLRAKWK